MDIGTGNEGVPAMDTSGIVPGVVRDDISYIKAITAISQRERIVLIGKQGELLIGLPKGRFVFPVPV